MKKISFILALGCMMAMTSCGGDKKAGEGEGSNKVVADASNASQDYAQYVDLTGDASIKADDDWVIVTLTPTIKAASNLMTNESTLVLLDENGQEVVEMNGGFDQNFNNAFCDGDTSYSQEVSFSYIADSKDKAKEMVAKAKSYKVTFTTKEPVVNKFGDWNPEGKYEFEDKDGEKFTLTLKHGGTAILYKPSTDYTENGSWSETLFVGDGTYKVEFPSGPFINLSGTTDFVTQATLTPNYIYLDHDSFEADTNCVEIKKVEE